jgi:hypothetical protein
VGRGGGWVGGYWGWGGLCGEVEGAHESSFDRSEALRYGSPSGQRGLPCYAVGSYRCGAGDVVGGRCRIVEESKHRDLGVEEEACHGNAGEGFDSSDGQERQTNAGGTDSRKYDKEGKENIVFPSMKVA